MSSDAYKLKRLIAAHLKEITSAPRRFAATLFVVSVLVAPNVSATPPITNETAQLIAADAAGSDLLGRSASFDRDIACVGAPGESSDQGAVYLFDRSQGGADNWGQIRKVVAWDGFTGDEFGSAVSIDGFILLVGSRSDGDSGVSAGSAYVFYEDQGGTDNWGHVEKLIPGDAAAGDSFGGAVDLNGSLAVVGAPSKSGGGAVYVFERNQGGTDNWGQIKKLVASDAASGDRFGDSVDINGDWIIVGAASNDDGGSAAGSAYIFFKDQGGTNNWGEVKKLTASDPAINDFFGTGVAIDGDVAVVGGDVNNPSGFSGPGAIYIFQKNQGGANNWGQVKKATASDGQNGDNLGFFVAIAGEYVIAGAPGDDSFEGALYVFMKDRGGANNYGERMKFTASSGAGGDTLGNGIGFGFPYVVSGAPGNDAAATAAGAAYVFELPIPTPAGIAAWEPVRQIIMD